MPITYYKAAIDRCNSPGKERKKVRQRGFEPLTYGLEVRCSILTELLAYRCEKQNVIIPIYVWMTNEF